MAEVIRKLYAAMIWEVKPLAVKRSRRSKTSIVQASPVETMTQRAAHAGARAGRAGVFASIVMAGFGVLIGAGVSYLGGQNQALATRYSGFQHSEVPVSRADDGVLREGQQVFVLEREPGFDAKPWQGGLREGARRRQVVRELLRGGDIPSLPAKTEALSNSPRRPQVAIIFDDIGLDRTAAKQIMSLSGPLTLSFLPYANNVQPLVDEARDLGHGVLLHLPMEPVGASDPGPHALLVDNSAKTLRRDLAWNLSQFTGYSGVNNHMGSKFTANRERMTLVLRALQKRGLYFVDSLTTGASAVPVAAVGTQIDLLSRDIFLDPTTGTNTVRAQLSQVEEIARKTGYAVAIAHPHSDTINVLGPWLTTANLRGFDLVTVDSLIAANKLSATGDGDFSSQDRRSAEDADS